MENGLYFFQASECEEERTLLRRVSREIMVAIEVGWRYDFGNFNRLFKQNKFILCLDIVPPTSRESTHSLLELLRSIRRKRKKDSSVTDKGTMSNPIINIC